jgi:hypothetical protein
MAYDEQLAERVRATLAGTAGAALAAWVGPALEFTATLPPKR